jgi:hypothetical protein
MTSFLFCNHILVLIIAITTVTANVGLLTQQGIIYGRQTQNSIEYLGYDKTNMFSDFCCDCSLEFNMQK